MLNAGLSSLDYSPRVHRKPLEEIFAKSYFKNRGLEGLYILCSEQRFGFGISKCGLAGVCGLAGAPASPSGQCITGKIS